MTTENQTTNEAVALHDGEYFTELQRRVDRILSDGSIATITIAGADPSHDSTLQVNRDPFGQQPGMMNHPDFVPPADDALRGSRWITDPDDEDTSTGWAYAEVACGDDPAVAFRVPVDQNSCGYMSADDAIALGALLLRVGGAAQGHHEA